jgi:hypothetical protein
MQWLLYVVWDMGVRRGGGGGFRGFKPPPKTLSQKKKYYDMCEKGGKRWIIWVKNDIFTPKTT